MGDFEATMLGDVLVDAGEPAHFCFAKSTQRICHVLEFSNKHDEQKPPVGSASFRTLGSNDVWFVHAVSARITSTGGNQARRAMQSRDFGVIGYRRTLLCARAGFHLPASCHLSQSILHTTLFAKTYSRICSSCLLLSLDFAALHQCMFLPQVMTLTAA